MKKSIFRVLLGIITILISIIAVLYICKEVLKIHQVSLVQWVPILASFIGFYFAGVFTKKIEPKFIFLLFFGLLVFIPLRVFYFPLIIYVLFFSFLALLLVRSKSMKVKKVLLLVGVLCFSYFLIKQPLIIEKKGFGKLPNGDLVNAKILWDFNEYKPRILSEKELFETPTGESFDLNSLNNKVIYITFWATWCKPCFEEKPELDKLKNEFVDSPNIVFVDISLDRNKDRWKNSLDKVKPNGIQLISKNESLTRRNFSLTGIPHHVIVNKMKEYKSLKYIPFAEKYLEDEKKLNVWIIKKRAVYESFQIEN